MEMDDELANFIRERKAKVAEDKASLEQDPPYMEMKVKSHKTYVSTAKENIPPRSHAQPKEESYNVGLPLGVEYERKKQKLRHELRMDYRRYMAQKKQSDLTEYGPLVHLFNKGSIKQHPLGEKADVLPKQRPRSLRDAGTLTEDNSALRKDLGLFSPEEYEEQSSVDPRQHDRLVRPVDQESEEEELELIGRRSRRTGVEAIYDMRLSNKADGRERRENPVDVLRESRRLRARNKNQEAEFTTGLLIGAADTDESLQRRKERYRQDLQEQIAEQHRNKKREKDLELKVAATGANDPEKQPDRIRQFGLSWGKYHQGLEPSTTGESELSLRGLSNNEKPGVRDKEVSIPDQPRVAFQSPLMDYSSALGLEGGGLSPPFPRSLDTPRIPLFPPHPPSTLSEVYRTSYREPPHYYGTRNPPDPNMAFYGHLSAPGASLPVSYWNVPAGGAVLSQLDNPSPHSQHSGSSYPETQIQPTSDAATVDSQFRVFPSERARSTRERILSYRDSLKQQIQEQQERRRLEREEKERHEAQLEDDMRNHQPWGRGGGGAPLRDSTGNLIADLNQMHKRNEEAYSNPEQRQRRATAAVTACQAEQPDLSERVSGTVAEHSMPNISDRLYGFTHVHTPQFARGNVFANQPTQQQLREQENLKAYLKQQMEEKRLKKAEESEQIRLEEEKEEKRLAEQRARIQKEYEEEQERKKRKEMEQKAKNEELIQLAEKRKKEAERKKKEEEEEEEKDHAALRRQYERERQARVEEVHREPSPPIPTLQKKRGLLQRTPRPLTVASQHSAAPLSEHSLPGLQSPPVPARRNQLRAAGNPRDVFSELSALRSQLRSEQKRLETRLHQSDWEELDPPLSDRHHERPLVDVFDMARLRLQAPVRRPNSRNIEAGNLLRIHDPLQLKYTDGDSRLGSSEVPKLEQVGVSSRRRRDYKDPYQHIDSQRSTVQDDYFNLFPPQQIDERQRSVTGGFERGSLLESESAFIDPLGNAFTLPHTSDQDKTPQLSARERRRLAKQSQRPQERASSSQSAGYHEDHFTFAGNKLQLKAEPSAEGRSRERADHRRALRRPGNTAGTADLSDDESPPSQFSLHNPNYQTSVETIATDLWMRPGTSETLKRLERPLRSDWLTT